MQKIATGNSSPGCEAVGRQLYSAYLSFGRHRKHCNWYPLTLLS
jgi:hypothetical protein